MKSNQRIHCLLGCFLLISLFSVACYIKKTNTIVFGITEIDKCSNIVEQADQCDFVKTNCDGFSGYYLMLYYCSPFWKPISILILLSCLLMLFGAISVVASDFFCPNLQTISSKLQLSESMAGVTVLAMGNGSPDLFSTFSAMDSNAGSLAIGELIGAAFFIVAIVSGCMGIIRPFQSQKITFMRDASFLTGAIIIVTWIVYHQRICWYHSVILICYYIAYVSTVVFSSYNTTPEDITTEQKIITNELIDEATYLLRQDKDTRPPKISIPDCGFSVHSNVSDLNGQLGKMILPVSPNSPKHSIYFDALPRSTSTTGSISARSYRRPMTPRVGIRTSVFGAIEFQEQVNCMSRTSSTNMMPQLRRRQSSMPPPMWQNMQQQSPQNPVDLAKPGRQRANTMTDHLLVNSDQHISKSPDTVYGSTGVVDDYFTYLSTQQQCHLPLPLSNPPPPPSLYISTEPASERTIPEIRLAPPNNDSPDSPESRNTHLWPNGQNRSRGNSTCYSLAPPSIHSENDVFVSARQSFDLSPSPSLAQRLSTAVYLGEDDFQRISEPSAMEEMIQILFPTLHGWYGKSLFSKLSALAALPLVLIFTLTLPVAEVEEVVEEPTHPRKDYLAIPSEHELNKLAEEPRQVWSKYLLITQAIISTLFISSIFITNELLPYYMILPGVGIGLCLAMFITFFTKRYETPSWFWALSFVGFFVALNWIFLLANQVVGLLQALGKISEVSDAIMGLTVFALGNSLGDFISNTTIAKMGFPTMAISACYAGPLLNMVLGVGVSSFYQIWKTGNPYPLDISPTIMISATGLITVLLSTLIVVNLNGYKVTKKLGCWMIFIYLTCLLVNLILEFNYL